MIKFLYMGYDHEVTREDWIELRYDKKRTQITARDVQAHDFMACPEIIESWIQPIPKEELVKALLNNHEVVLKMREYGYLKEVI